MRNVIEGDGEIVDLAADHAVMRERDNPIGHAKIKQTQRQHAGEDRLRNGSPRVLRLLPQASGRFEAAHEQEGEHQASLQVGEVLARKAGLRVFDPGMGVDQAA